MLESLVDHVLQRNVPGDFVEAGVSSTCSHAPAVTPGCTLRLYSPAAHSGRTARLHTPAAQLGFTPRPLACLARL